MIKTCITALFLSIATAFSALAADAYGWTKFPLFDYEVSSMVSAKDKVYFVSCGTLYSFDESSQETYCYSSLNKLTGDRVKEIYYNFEDSFLLIVYEDSNMDVLYDDGSLINLPEIRDSSITSSKTINDIAFGQNLMLIGADFGIVIYDLKKMEVRESGIFNKKVSAVCIENDRYSIYAPSETEWNVWFAPISGRHNSMSKFTKLSWGLLTDAVISISDTKYLFRNPLTGEVYTRDTNASRDDWSGSASLGIASKAPLRPYKKGYCTYTDQEFVYIENGEAHKLALPEDLRGQLPAIYDNPSKLWLANIEGVGKYDISNVNSPETLYGKIIPYGVTTVGSVGFMRWSADGERLYVSNRPFSTFKAWKVAEGSDVFQATNIIEDGFPVDASLMEASAEHQKNVVKWQQQNGNKRMYGDVMSIVEDPDDPSVYYCANNFEGVYVIKRNEQTGEYEEIGKFNDKNSGIVYISGSRALDVNIDPQGNLWVGQFRGTGYTVLPADKRRKNPKDVTAADWKDVQKITYQNVSNQDMGSLICKKSNMVFIFSGKYEGVLTALDTKGTYDNFTDDAVYSWTRYTDQDGLTFEAPQRISCAIEDSRGCVWIGTSNGIFEIPNPSQATNSDMRVRRIKVPRNDGTDYADYLLDSDMIYGISEDPAGRKWIATESSGLFLVSEAGDKILKNFTTENSPLPSNMVTAVECDPKSNKVYVGTDDGLYSFLSDAAPGTNDLSDILVYPNPVRPEFTGEVTITGLMDNSIVKVADAQGSVVYQTRSQGGMATWNPSTSSGARVRTGVYFIYATSSDGSRQIGGVSKIMIVN